MIVATVSHKLTYARFRKLRLRQKKRTSDEQKTGRTLSFATALNTRSGFVYSAYTDLTSIYRCNNCAMNQCLADTYRTTINEGISYHDDDIRLCVGRSHKY